MEYGLWHGGKPTIFDPVDVLILVLMEYGLWLSDLLRDSFTWLS